ncbi:NADH dehydrogenase FAD-containing subunit [Pullulanibacillus pueri]|uniref:FAD/NAD(P)-binding domain-containing protein n=1 Tax=Pullulanibacillus pueri TaxID=1437324 RepID=A0A8J2ZUS1_9BACL|nr:FAD-dependent oxidoreductase [Pullulanibacillus pueri]MBM7681302.1 NADH dehydrogenase FAD-containing subunit [Pullulanibacillus pueri]GGH77675.1 hypothetical protein GCM10007096_09920 [Pullulanibacillus pueri]
MIKKLLLIGAQRAHLQLLKQFKDTPQPLMEVTLLTPDKYYYHSGLLPELIEGHNELKKTRLNIEPLATQANVKWIKAAALSLDAPRKRILTDRGDLLAFDIVSFNIEGLNEGGEQPLVADKAVTLQQKSRFLQRVPKLRTSDNLVIVGGSQTAIEIAFSFQAWRNKNKVMQPVTLICHPTFFPGCFPKLSTKLEKRMKSQGIHLIKTTSLPTVQENRLLMDSTAPVPYTDLLWLTPPRGPRMFEQALLPTDEKGFLRVEETLQVKAFPYIFGAGECISLSQTQVGVDLDTMVSLQADILWENLRGYALNGEGYLYEPPKNTGSTLYIGNQAALYLFQNHSLKSKRAWRVKVRAYHQFLGSLNSPPLQE